MRPALAVPVSVCAMALFAGACGTSASPAPSTAGGSGVASSEGGTSASGSPSGASAGNSSGSGSPSGATTSGASAGSSGSAAASGASSGGSSGGAGSPAGDGGSGSSGSTSDASSSGSGSGSGVSSGSSGVGSDGGARCVSPATAATDWGRLFADTVVQQGFGTFAPTSYPVGLAMHGIYKVYKRTKDAKYLTFLTAWANGHSASPAATSVDGIMHMTAVADAYELSMNAALKAPLDATRRIFDAYPRTTDGAFWHNTGARGQNWGDTSFMALSFLTRYGTVMNDITTYAEGSKQITLFASHLKNPATGLFFHAYDETASAPWVVPGTRHSPESWGRAMGWFAMATVMVLEELPAADPGRAPVEAILKDLVGTLKKYQDPATGRWFQVVDKGSMPGNWLETSCTAMYSYATWWAATHGLVDSTYCDVAIQGFGGVLQQASTDPTKLLTGVCEGTGVGDYAYYIGRNHTRYNDFHGLGSFLLMWEGMQ